MIAIPYALALACLAFGAFFVLWTLACMSGVLEDRPAQPDDQREKHEQDSQGL